MSRAEPPEQLKARLPHEPALWARNFLRHPNDPTRPYDFYDDTQENFLHYLVDDDGPLKPENWGDINVLLFARGCLKTFTVSTLSAWGCDMFPTLEVVATAPRDDQRGEVIDRFKLKVEQSGLIERRVKDNEGHQKFKNMAMDPKTGEKYTAYSHLKSRSAWGEGNALRGLHGHMGVIDESQDVDEGTFSTFLEAIDRRVPQVDYFPTIFVIGTPKMANTFFHRLWEYSDKKTWDDEAKEWVTQDEPTEFLPEELRAQKAELAERVEELEFALENADEGEEAEIYRELEHARNARDSIEGFTVKGWHIDQHNSPLHDDRSIAFKRETYSKMKFANEVEARFYSPEHDLLTTDDVMRALEPEMDFRSQRLYSDSTVGLAVDWGGGAAEGAASTVVVVGEMADWEIEIRHFEIFDSDMSRREEREEIDKLMHAYGVDVAVVDEGYGDSDRQALQDEYGHDNLYGCWYGNVKKKEEIKWNRFKSKKRFFTANKPYMVNQMAEDFKAGRFVIPKRGLSFATKRDKGTMLVQQLTAPYTDRDETVTGRKNLKVISDQPDDIFDAFTYLWIALNHVTSRRTLHKVGSVDRPGY